MGDPDSAAAVERLAARYGEAWSRHDVEAIVSMHAPGMVFESHTLGERAEGDAVRAHIAAIFENWPDLALRTRRTCAKEGLVVVEWTATATRRPTGELLEWDGVDVMPVENGLIARNDVYSGSRAPRVLRRA